MDVVAVKDANILIDCAEIGILDYVFQLPLHFITSDFIWEEILQAHQQKSIQRFIERGSLTVVSFSSEEVNTIADLLQRHTGISLEDSSAMYLAEKETAVLLTGDSKLRKICQSAGIQVHGIIWLLDEIYNQQLIDRNLACEKIRLLQLTNTRLPKAIVQDRIRHWCT